VAEADGKPDPVALKVVKAFFAWKTASSPAMP
jgi:hypothetical protein